MKAFSFRVVIHGTINIVSDSSEQALEELKSTYDNEGVATIAAMLIDSDVMAEPISED